MARVERFRLRAGASEGVLWQQIAPLRVQVVVDVMDVEDSELARYLDVIRPAANGGAIRQVARIDEDTLSPAGTAAPSFVFRRLQRLF